METIGEVTYLLLSVGRTRRGLDQRKMDLVLRGGSALTAFAGREGWDMKSAWRSSYFGRPRLTNSDDISVRLVQRSQVLHLLAVHRPNDMPHHRCPAPDWTRVPVQRVEGRQSIDDDRYSQNAQIRDTAEDQVREGRPYAGGTQVDGGEHGWDEEEGHVRWETERLALAEDLVDKLECGGLRSTKRSAG